MQSIENKIYRRICGNGRGWTFSNNEFSDIGSPASIDIALHRLYKSGKIRRVFRGIYDYPKYSDLLGQWLSPDIDRTAHALARRSGWRIQPSGNTALNLLGISTQVPARFIYLSNGPNRIYRIGGIDLTFKKTTLKEAALQHRESALLVQAIKALTSQNNIDEFINLARKRFSISERKRILKDTRYITDWIVEIIRRICREEEE
ncbi:MAG TPA: hypothetical protein ENH12_01075 [Proteobacteria bacterium]|nr:hypothetical protein [Pseudomonadota bacterium]